MENNVWPFYKVFSPVMEYRLMKRELCQAVQTLFILIQYNVLLITYHHFIQTCAYAKYRKKYKIWCTQAIDFIRIVLIVAKAILCYKVFVKMNVFGK